MTRGDWGGKISPPPLWKIAAGGPRGKKKKEGKKGRKRKKGKGRKKKRKRGRKGREKSKVKVFFEIFVLAGGPGKIDLLWLGVQTR